MIKNIVKLTVSLILLIFLIWTSEISSVWQQIITVQWPTILGCMAALFLAQALSSLRWQWILRSEGAEIPFKTLFASYMAGMFVNNFVPTSIGGDSVKAYDIYRLTKNISLSIVSVFLERFSGLMALAILSWFGALSLLSNSSPTVIGGWIFINFVCIFIIAFIFHEPTARLVLWILTVRQLGSVGKALRPSFENLNSYRNKKALLVKTLFVSFPIQLVTILIYQIIAVSMGVNLHFIFFLFSVPLIILISLLPISFGGLGVREGMTVFMFSMAGVPKYAALSVSLVYLSVIYLVSLIGGFFLILRSVKKSRGKGRFI
ncbi:MAG: flippase-like domain-containing protein [Deltaproteobacteria bacterium]|nr:flippase-like domain-containing protein [Deltaproteobacteria bacterium]